MAASMQKAQAILTCPYCDGTQRIKWKCTNCLDIFCDGCKKIHTKQSATKDHNVVLIKDMNEQMLKDKWPDVHCPDHKDKCDFFCNLCETTICSKCILKDHKTHDFEHLEAFREKLVEMVDALVANVEYEDQQFTKFASGNFKSFDDANNTEKEKIKAAILERKRYLTAHIDEKSNGLLNELNQHFQQRQDKSRSVSKEKILKDEISQIRTLKDKALEELKSKDVSKLTPVVKQIEENIRQFSSKMPGRINISFQPGALDYDDFARKFGSMSYAVPTSEGKLTILQRFPTELKSVFVLFPVGNNLTWVGNVNESGKGLMLIDNDNSTRRVKTVKTSFTDSCYITNDDHLIVSDVKNHTIKSIATDGSVKTIANLKPLVSSALYVTSTGELIVGAVDSYNLNTTQVSRRQLLKLSKTGEVLHTWEYDPRGNRLFTLPARCALNENNNEVIVADRNTHSLKIICVALNGEVRFVYQGDPTLPQQFWPAGVVCTKTGEIIVNDFLNDALHFLDSTGKCLRYIATANIGIVGKPQSIFLDKRGYFWIGTGPLGPSGTKGEVFKLKYT